MNYLSIYSNWRKVVKKNKLSYVLLALILISSAFFMLNASYNESAIMDELAHIPSGYSYVKYFDYRLNPEHPPLVKALSEIPLLFMDLSFPTDKDYWKSGINSQWISGNEFIYKYNGEKAEDIVFYSRIFPIILTLLLSFLVFIWSKEILGKYWALLPTLFTALSPNILTHGHYVTTDIGAAFGFLVGMYFFIKYLNNSSIKSILLAGLFFGIAELAKFSTVLLVPIFLIIIVFAWWAKIYGRKKGFISKESISIIFKYIRDLIVIFIIGMLLVWVVYALFTANYPIEKQVQDTSTILESFSGGSELGMKACLPQNLSMRCLAEVNIWMASTPVIRSFGQYMLGVLMVMQRSSGGNTAYFLGKLGGGGWWYYFPTVFILKETIPVLILMFFGLFMAIRRIFLNLKKSNSIKRIRDALFNYISLNTAEFSMIVFVVFYWIYSIRSPLNIGFRHILPTLPFIYILTTSSIKRWFESSPDTSGVDILNKFRIIVKGKINKITKVSLLGIAVIWFVSIPFAVNPYFLSYFNELSGGVWDGYKHATDSNYDWGQDLKRLRDFVEENDIDKIAVDYFGGADVKYYLGDKAVLWNGDKGNPLDEGIKWLAISINTIGSARAPVYEGFEKQNPNAYDYVYSYKNPYNRAGTSIFIYKLGL